MCKKKSKNDRWKLIYTLFAALQGNIKIYVTTALIHCDWLKWSILSAATTLSMGKYLVKLAGQIVRKLSMGKYPVKLAGQIVRELSYVSGEAGVSNYENIAEVTDHGLCGYP